jgi:crossover junction endodeoxyribonuclease RusA
MVTFTVYGTPAPQGSKRALGRGVMVESSAKVAPWRADVRTAALAAHPGPPMPGPLPVAVVFTLAKPKSAPKRRRVWPDKRPDIDKLTRSTFDALTSAGVYIDDAQVVRLYAEKTYAGDPGALDRPGATVTVAPLAKSLPALDAGALAVAR